MRLSSQLLLTFLLNACWQIALMAPLPRSDHGFCELLARYRTGFGHVRFVSRFLFRHSLIARRCSTRLTTTRSARSSRKACAALAGTVPAFRHDNRTAVTFK
jgi:hypothetical protein